MINKMNNTTNKAKPPEKPQPPQLPPNPIIVPPLDKRGKQKVTHVFNGFKLLYVFTHELSRSF
jgi:hypothetical protein